MPTITVANIRDGAHDIAKPGVEYVGRPTALGNPFHLQNRASDAKRAEVIANYRGWLGGMLAQPGSDQSRMFARLRAAAMEGDLVLVCWCSPKPCHADVIAEMLRASLAESEAGE